MINTSNIQETLINNLIALRKASGLTQIELGEKINYSDKTISKWEKGDSCPNIEAICRIAVFYGITVDELLTEGVQAEEQSANVKQRKYSKIVISMLAVVSVWIIAMTVFVSELLMGYKQPWLIFVFAPAVSAAVLLVFNSMWGNKRLNYILLTVMLWTLLTTIYLSALEYAHILWVIYLIGIPIQAAIILWSQLKRRRGK